MKLNFSHTGRQFFFITLTLEDRVQALSRLVDAKSRPSLLPAGETLRDVLLALHRVYPAATLSDFVIMPDHIHFLLIVDFDRSPTFNPLWVSFILMATVEEAWRLNGRGQAPEPPTAAPREPAAEKAAALAFAENLLRATVAREQRRAGEVNRLIASGLSRTEALAQLGGIPRSHPIGGVSAQSPASRQQGFGGAAPVHSGDPLSQPPLLFNRRAYIELSFDSRQLKAIRRYIKLNPARAIWKRDHPDRFHRFGNIGHSILDPARHWSAIGNLTLLGSPFLFHVRLTLKKTVAEHEAAIAEIVARAERGEVPVSGFISPGEVEALRRLKATPNARFIKLLPCALPPRYDPSAEDSRELAADRMLILSGFSDTPAISAIEMRRDPAAARAFRRNCLALNDLASALCENAACRAKG